jgi:hypothetical protein
LLQKYKEGKYVLLTCKIFSKLIRNNLLRIIVRLLLIYPKKNTFLGSSMEINARKHKRNNLQQYYLIHNKIMAPRILQDTNISSKASKKIIHQEKNMPNSTKDHERKMREWGRDGREKRWRNEEG